MGRLTDVVKHLLIINVIVFVAFGLIFKQYAAYLYLYPNEVNFQPYQIVSHMFMHGSETHILFNMMSLFFLGPMVERGLGAKNFLIFYLICGMGSMLLHLALVYIGFLPSNVAVVGASGAIMGIFIAFALMYPDVKLMLLFPPIPIKAKYLMLGLVAFDLFSGVSGLNTGIAHFAHLGGAITGFILMVIWKKVSFLR